MYFFKQINDLPLKIKIIFSCYWGVRIPSGVTGSIGAVTVSHDTIAAVVLLEDIINVFSSTLNFILALYVQTRLLMTCLESLIVNRLDGQTCVTFQDD